MANEEHLTQLKQGVEAWNQWREAHRDIEPDLREADLRGMDLCKANLGGTHILGANLLVGANLRREADLRKANLGGTLLLGANLHRADLTEADLHDAQLWGADLTEARLTGANLREAHISQVNLTLGDHAALQANLTKADLTGAHLTGAHLGGANLAHANLIRADLRKAEFHDANLAWADLTGANLAGANLVRALLLWADLTGANLAGARLADAHLVQTVLAGADLSEAIIGLTTFANVDLSTARGIETAHHEGPSTIGIDTIYCSEGNIPEVFLRGAGVPEDMITYMKSLVGRPFEFYSCFISYSSKDQEFAERLYADLQRNEVRCWFAPHDIQGGRKIDEQIDQAIHLHDRLLLILSAHSMHSNWVQTEIAKARQREVQEKRRVLFPMRLVPFEAIRTWKCFDPDTGNDSAHEIRGYFIPDFSNWTDHDIYQVAFQRLLRDLKADI